MKMKKFRVFLSVLLCMLVIWGGCGLAAMVTDKGLTISKEEVTLLKGKTVKLNVRGAGSRKIVWSSDNKKIAKVSTKGLVKGVRAGETVIRAKVKGQELTCRVTVEDPSISDKTVTLTVGQTHQLTMNGTKQSVVWKSGKPKVATVDENGLVTAVSAGKTTVVAKIGSKKWSCAVTVEAAETPTLSQTSLIMKKWDHVTLSVSGTKQKVTWTSSNKNVAKVNAQGVVVAVGSGWAIITARVGEQELECRVNVNGNLTVDRGELHLKVGGNSGLINISYTNEKLYNAVIYRADVGGVITFSAGSWNGKTLPLYINPIGKGTAVVTIIHESSGEQHTVIVTVE